MNFGNIDRRIVYLLVILFLSIPIILDYRLKPADLKAATKVYDYIEDLSVRPGQIAFVSMDFGPNTKAENQAQTEVFLEHLMRKRIPFAVYSLYAQAQKFLDIVPKNIASRLHSEQSDQTWEYGKDWVNLGFKVGTEQFVQSIPNAENLADFFQKDAYGNYLSDLDAFKHTKGFEDIILLGQFTGLVGMLDIYIQFFQKKNYVPPIFHGCTSITIPEAYNFLDSGQLSGLFEGLAGAAWYSELLERNNPGREQDSSGLMNTALGIGHLLIIFLVVIGNVSMLMQRKKQSSKGQNG